MNRIKAVIFDLDGTLGNTLPLCIAAFRKAVEPLIDRSLTDDEIIATFGPSEEGTIMALAPNHYDKGIADYLSCYSILHDLCPEPFEGIVDLLKYLQHEHIRIAMVTGKGTHSTATTLERFGLSPYFERIETGESSGPSKESGIRRVLAAFEGLTNQEVVYVGDAPSDIVACNKVGIPVFAAAWAHTTNPQHLLDLNPDAIFYTVDALTHWFQNQPTSEYKL